MKAKSAENTGCSTKTKPDAGEHKRLTQSVRSKRGYRMLRKELDNCPAQTVTMRTATWTSGSIDASADSLFNTCSTRAYNAEIGQDSRESCLVSDAASCWIYACVQDDETVTRGRHPAAPGCCDRRMQSISKHPFKNSREPCPTR